jgi:lycopene cyclase domain-containing protein
VTYTVTAVLGVLFSLALDCCVLRTRLVGRRAFWLSYAVLLGFQLLVDGVLAGRHVVRYDAHTIVGAHLFYEPVEDLAFGFALVLQTLCWWTWLGRRDVARSRPAANS